MNYMTILAIAAITLVTAVPGYPHGGESEEKSAEKQHEMMKQAGHEESTGHSQGAGHHGGMHNSHWNAPAEAASRPNPIEATEESIQRGKAVFQSYCVSCHGSGARGDGVMAGSLKPTPADLASMAPMHPAGDLAWKIETGRGAMPAWKGTLCKMQIWDIVNYLKSLDGDDNGEGMPYHGHDSQGPSVGKQQKHTHHGD